MPCTDADFCHIHRHSEFSPLDGTGNAIQYAETAASLGQQWLGLTDHHTFGGALDHIRACRMEGVKRLKGGLVDMDSEIRPGEKRHLDERITPIVGCELFWVGGDPYGSRGEKDYSHNVKPHLCVHASGIRGWQALLGLITDSNLTGFHGVPRCDWELFDRYADHLVVTSACISSPPNRMIMAGDYDGAIEWHRRMRDRTRGRYWIELMGHDLDQQRVCNVANVNIAQELGIGLVATSDAHYFDKEWSDTQEIVFAISRKDSLKKRAELVRKAQEKREKGDPITKGDEVYGKDLGTQYIMTAQEMRDLFASAHPDIPADIVDEALRNTTEVARSCRPYVISRDLKMPDVKAVAEQHIAGMEGIDEIVERVHGEPVEVLLRAWVQDGIGRIVEQRGSGEWERVREQYSERLEYEMDTLRSKGVMGYFVLVGDIVRDARANGIAVGPGRGSAAGCLVSYLIGITGLDPIPYGLLFERFMNPDRVGMPDIDVDFSDRDWVIARLREKYGEECVAPVITYSTFGPRASLNDISRFFDDGESAVDYMDLQRAKENIGILDKDIAKLVQSDPNLRAFAEKYPEPWKHMERVDDMVRAPSKHASAVVIAGRPIKEFAPIQRVRGQKTDGSEDSFVVAWADRAKFPIISEFGLMKFDALGLEELKKLEYACDLVEERTGDRPDIWNNPVAWDPDAGEPEVLEMFGQGKTVGIFQFVSQGITNLLRAIKPTHFNDIIAANAMHRPGPMEFEYDYAKRKNGDEPVAFWHDGVRPFLGETYGLPAYQEQIMQICKALGNFSGGQADSMRKAMSKLYRLPGDEAERYMANFREQWDEGCAANGIDDETRDRIWSNILSWGKYGFNKSHSACYALIAYLGMWLKRHYPREFYAALLSYPGKLDAQDAIREASSEGVKILPPDINLSDRRFRLEGDAIRYGLISVKNVGGATVTRVLDHRPYESFADFLERHRKPEGEDAEEVVGIGDALNLLRAGAFDAIDDRLHWLSLVDATDEDRHVVGWSCGAAKKGVKFDPRDPYERNDDGSIATFRSGKRKGQQKRREVPECPKHRHEEWYAERPCAIEDVTPYRDKRTVAEHVHHNMRLKFPRPIPSVQEPPTTREIAEAEQDALGISLTIGSVVVDNRDLISQVVDTRDEFERAQDGAEVIVGGEIVRVSKTKVKKKGPNEGKPMAFFDVQFGPDRFPCTIFHHLYHRYAGMLDSGAVMVQGRKDTWSEKASVIVKHMQPVEEFVRECQQEDER